MKIFFDVDFTLITFDVKLRPGVHEIFQLLRDEGHTLYLWSGYGPRHEVVERFKLHEHISGLYWKPLYDHRARLEELGVKHEPDYVVDDHEDIVKAFPGTLIRPAEEPLAGDREMWRVYGDIQEFARVRAALGQATPDGPAAP